MPDEGSFLRAILANPTDDLPRLVYADWLDEQQTDEASRKAEFIRIQAALGKGYAKQQHKRNRVRIRELSAELPVGWLAAVAHVAVENCEAGGSMVADWRLRRSLDTVEFAYECPRDWAGMTLTDEEKVRHCGACRKNVHFCETIAEAQYYAWAGECVAVNLSVPRSAGDIEMVTLAGLVAPEYWHQADEEKEEGSS